MPWSFTPKPENVMVKPEIQDRVVELSRKDKVRAVGLLREETGLPLKYATVLVDYWLQEK
jgi:hypothetical protein